MGALAPPPLVQRSVASLARVVRVLVFFSRRAQCCAGAVVAADHSWRARGGRSAELDEGRAVPGVQRLPVRLVLVGQLRQPR